MSMSGKSIWPPVKLAAVVGVEPWGAPSTSKLTNPSIKPLLPFSLRSSASVSKSTYKNGGGNAPLLFSSLGSVPPTISPPSE